MANLKRGLGKSFNVIFGTCTWENMGGDMDGNYKTECGNIFTLNSGTPIENEFNYCPFCGKKIEESKCK